MTTKTPESKPAPLPPAPKPPAVPKCNGCGQNMLRCSCKGNNLNK